MRDLYVLGVATTRFQRWPDRTHKQLADEVLDAVLADAGAPDVHSVWFGSCGLHCWGQANIGGQVVLDQAFRDGRLPRHAPVMNIEGGCATGGLALLGAARDVLSGEAEVSLAIGVEKTFMPHDPAGMMALFDGALDQLDREHWQQEFAAGAAELGVQYAPHPHRIQLLDVCALQAQHHMARHGTTAAQIAASASKNHGHAVHNDNAQYQQPMTIEQVLADKPVLPPLTRAMCAPISDGAAAVIVISADALAALPAEQRERAVRLRSLVSTSGAHRRLGEPSLVKPAAARAYDRAGLSPDDIDLVELHDATSFAELHLSEELGFCEAGRGGAYVASGAATLGGRRPANTSGGLVSKGHPLAATGLAMVHEVVTQLRGDAGDRQVDNARVAMVQNGGGLVGFDEAATVVGIFGV